MQFLHLVIALWLVVNFGSFIWAALAFFKLKEGEGVPRETKWLSYLLLSCQALITAAVLLTTLSSTLSVVASALVLAASTALFWWTLRIHGQRRLTAAYASDQPEHLVQSGPYRWIRHPFYTAYILSYVGGLIAAPVWWAIPALLIPYAAYLHASRFEERKFAQSTLGEAYAAYKQRTGRFWPRMW